MVPKRAYALPEEAVTHCRVRVNWRRALHGFPHFVGRHDGSGLFGPDLRWYLEKLESTDFSLEDFEIEGPPPPDLLGAPTALETVKSSEDSYLSRGTG